MVFFRDLERATKLVLRFLFYASPIIYGITDLPEDLALLGVVQPARRDLLALPRRRSSRRSSTGSRSAISRRDVSVVLLVIGILVFRRTERAVLKEI